MGIEKTFWPFPIIKPESEWDAYDSAFVNFMETAFKEGFKPYRDSTESLIGAGAPTFRTVALVFRGSRSGWEPWIVSERGVNHQLGPRYGFNETTCMVIRPFQAASNFALAWLRGTSFDEILTEYVLVPMTKEEGRKHLELRPSSTGRTALD